MNEGDLVVFGTWLGDGYGEYIAYVRDDGWGSKPKIDLTYTCGDGLARRACNVRHIDDIDPEDDYYRVDEAFEEVLPFDRNEPLSGRAVWVNYVRDDRARPYRGLILGLPEGPSSAFPVLRVSFYDTRRNRDRIRTLVHESVATLCDNFWSDSEPAPHDCDDDDDD